MPDRLSYETGARKFPAKQDADASHDFSQAAAGNGRPEGYGPDKTDRRGKRKDPPIRWREPQTLDVKSINRENTGCRRSGCEHSKVSKAPNAGNPEPMLRSEPE